MGTQASAPSNQAAGYSNGQSSMMLDSFRDMLPDGFEAAVNDAFVAPDAKGKGKGKPTMQLKGNGKGQMCKGKGDGQTAVCLDAIAKGKGKGKPDDSSNVMNLSDLKGTGKGVSFALGAPPGKGLQNGPVQSFASDAPIAGSFAPGKMSFAHNGRSIGECGSYDSFASNAPLAGSFAAGVPPKHRTFQTDPTNRNSFALGRSEESFAAALPASSAHASRPQLPVCTSFVTGQQGGITTQAGRGCNTQPFDHSSSFFMPTTNTPSPQGCSTQAPHCASFRTAVPQAGYRGRPGMDMIRE